MSNLTLRLSSLGAITLITLASALTIYTTHKQHQDLHHASEKHALRTRLSTLEVELLQAKHELAVTEANLDLQTSMSELNKERVENFKAVQRASEGLIEAGREKARRYEDVVLAAEGAMAALRRRVEELEGENARLRMGGDGMVGQRM